MDTSAVRLDELAESEHPQIRRNVARHPSASVSALRKLAVEFPEEVGSNPALQLYLLGVPHLFASFSANAVNALARLPTVIDSCGDALFENVHCHAALALNPATPARLLERIAEQLRTSSFREALARIEPSRALLVSALTSLEMQVRIAALEHEQAPKEVVEVLKKAGADDRLMLAATPRPALAREELRLLLSWGPWARLLATRSMDLPHDVMVTLVNDPESEVRTELARRRDLPHGVMVTLANDPELKMRTELARRKDLPREVLDILARDPEEMVQRALIFRGGLPASIQLVLAQNALIQNQQALAQLPELTEATLEYLFDNALETHRQLARREDIGVARLEVFLKDKEPRIVRVAASNPSLPATRLRELAREESEHVRKGVASNPSTPSDCLVALAKTGELLALSNPMFPLEHMATWIDVPGPQGQDALARNPSLPVALARRIAASPSAETRKILAGNQAINIDLLREMAQDPSDWVRAAVFRNAKCPRGLVEAAATGEESEYARNAAQAVLARLEDQS